MILQEAYDVVIHLMQDSIQNYEGIPKQRAVEAFEMIKEILDTHITNITRE